jgi:hypothetical protein
VRAQSTVLRSWCAQSASCGHGAVISSTLSPQGAPGTLRLSLGELLPGRGMGLTPGEGLRSRATSWATVAVLAAAEAGAVESASPSRVRRRVREVPRRRGARRPGAARRQLTSLRRGRSSSASDSRRRRTPPSRGRCSIFDSSRADASAGCRRRAASTRWARQAPHPGSVRCASEPRSCRAAAGPLRASGPGPGSPPPDRRAGLRCRAATRVA